MSELPTYSSQFLQGIRLSSNQITELKESHETLRRRLNEDPALSSCIVSTFLQGSYRRATIVKPKAEKRSDVDIIVVTNLCRFEHTPEEVLQMFVPFCEEYYRDKYEINGRSIGIEMSKVDLDIVVTSAPSEVQEAQVKSQSVRSMATLAEAQDWRFNTYWPDLEAREQVEARSWLHKAATAAEWKAEPLWIPDRDAGAWQETNPLEQLRWTRDKNQATNGHYVNVVKALKWWRRAMQPTPKRPKGYPLEHLIGECCPGGIDSVAQGVVGTLEEIRDRYSLDAALERTPVLPDRGTDENVMKRVPGEEFAAFHEKVTAAAELARAALEETDNAASAARWRELFGSEFPEGSQSKSGGGPGGAATGGFSERSRLAHPSGGRFA